MNVTFQTFSLKPIFTGQKQISNSYHTKPYAEDVFTRSADSVSFTGIDKRRAKDVVKDMALIGIAGGAFLFTLAGTAKLMAKMEPTDIFLSDGTYLFSVDDLSLKTDNIEADGVTGAVNFKGTPINIQPDKYDYVDAERGIYRNNDGSVDIDLLNHKYIDVENKIFIDPERKISAMFDGESMQNVVIPDFSFKGYSLDAIHGAVHTPDSRSEYFEKHGHYPEHDYPQYAGEVKQVAGTDMITLPDDNRDFMQKLTDFFNPLSPNKFPNHKFDRGRDYDIFGREIISVKDNNGHITKIAVDEKIAEFAKEHNFSREQIGDIVNFVDATRLKDYLKSQPELSAVDVAGYKTIDEFINGTQAHDVPGADDIDVPDTEHPDVDHTTIVELFDGILLALHE